MIGGGLFSRFFLEEGIALTPEWAALDAGEVAAAKADLLRLWQAIAAHAKPNEAETEHEIVYPLLERLGWQHLPQQEAGRGRTHLPDALLFLTPEAKAEARKTKDATDRYRTGLGVVVVEAEARDRLLDRASAGRETPASQILRYLGRAEGLSGGAIKWGLLTNGRLWRLYYADARARAEGFVEFDLPAILGEGGALLSPGGQPDYWLKAFLLLFRRDALQPDGPDGSTFLARALDEGRRYEERATARLSEAVFVNVFPKLIEAIADGDPKADLADPDWQAAAREAALRLLYRLLFLLYAEDRDLLPLAHPGYRAYSLRGLRDEAAKVADGEKTVSSRAVTWWQRLKALFLAIAEGDPSMGLPPYNGGLFDDAEAPLLARVELPDAVLAPILDAISREQESGQHRTINYRDLSVQQLGSIYERLLEFDLVEEDGRAALRPNPFARKTTGSYYTPEELVRLILRRAVGPLLAERRKAFADCLADVVSAARPKAERRERLERFDPAMHFLDLRVCDPAMGSGHFLVSLVDFLSDEVLSAMAEAATDAAALDYRSPLAGQIERIRAHIVEQATAHGWSVRADQLDDRHIVRRIVLKRVIYGVDLNPMAVELAKLSLWLHSFTVGAPLSFLDHHLRCGDSLFGEFVRPVEDLVAKSSAMFLAPAVAAARAAAAGMLAVEQQTDADIAEVRSSARAFEGVEADTAPLLRLFDLVQASRWLAWKPKSAEGKAWLAFLAGTMGDPVAVAADPARLGGKGESRRMVQRLLAEASALARQRRFLHWEAAFPGVWDRWESAEPEGGFDALVGNPPWDRMKLQEVEWFEARVPEIAKAQRAADRKKLVTQLRKKGGRLAHDYEAAVWTAEAAARVARDCGAYPLLGGGDVNLYSLFVERALRLVKSDGIMGLLVPSGIAADKGAAEFFRSVSTTGRLSALFDFENRRTALGAEHFFPDVDSRFKFCAFVVGGRKRRFEAAACAFFKASAIQAEVEAFALTPDDFSAVNPNTGTAPVFRSQRDADITLGIYRRLPVLVDQRAKPPRAVWPVRYLRMFDMANDSALFRTAAELEKLGAYRVAGSRWKRKAEEWLPLFVGKTIHHFDHRAASVIENPENVHNPFLSLETNAEQHAEPGFSPAPQFWVAASDLGWPASLQWGIGFRDIARPTDARTLIASLVPKAGYGNTSPLLLPADDEPAKWMPLLVANLSSMATDYLVRQKVQGTHVNLYILEQIALVPAPEYAKVFGCKTAEQIIRDDVLRLTYVSHDMAPFARDQGFKGDPFPWNEEDRLRRRARLDALFFHLYGLDRETADYILTTFPIVAREEVQKWGRFRSRDLILGFMAALAAGDPDAAVVG